jgi:hypothetical protein
MSIVSRPLRMGSLALCLFAVLAAPTAHAQANSSSNGETPLHTQLSRLDFAVNAMATITKNASGTNYLGADLTQTASNTVGFLGTIRYTKSPYLGGEFNYTYARFTQHYNDQNGQDPYLGAGGSQANTSELTLGYVIHPPHRLLTAKPFVAVGVGSTVFRPTTGGGQALLTRARMTYYYAAGLEKELNNHFDIRVQIRQTFYKAPDFGQNYLYLNAQTWTLEPAIGFVFHY